MTLDDPPETGLRRSARDRVDELRPADLWVGIPCFNNDRTVRHVVETVARGVRENFSDRRTVIMVSDGGSLDDTREEAAAAELPPGVETLVTIYRGLPGKGSAFRAIFEAALRAGVEGCLVVDSDLRKFPPAWVREHVQPVLEEDQDLMVPLYIRHKYDATITNNVCFPVVSALFGRNIRQPIGGDFTVSPELMDFYTRQPVWGTNVAKFGIDIWMTVSALCEGFNVAETHLGAKIHDPKDPGEALGPMFRQVVGTLFGLLGCYASEWWERDEVQEPRRFGPPVDDEPKPVSVNRYNLEAKAYQGWLDYRDSLAQFLSDESFQAVESTMESYPKRNRIGMMTVREWARVLFDCAVTFNFSDADPNRVLDALVPIYFCRCVGLFHEMDPMVGEEAELYVRELVRDFRVEKQYLRDRWPEDPT